MRATHSSHSERHHSREVRRSYSAPSSPLRLSTWAPTDTVPVVKKEAYHQWYNTRGFGHRHYHDPRAPIPWHLPKDYPTYRYHDIIPLLWARGTKTIARWRHRHRFARLVMRLIGRVVRLQRFVRDAQTRAAATQKLALWHIRKFFPTPAAEIMAGLVEEYCYSINVENYARAMVRERLRQGSGPKKVSPEVWRRKSVLSDEVVKEMIARPAPCAERPLCPEVITLMAQATENSDVLFEASQCLDVVLAAPAPAPPVEEDEDEAGTPTPVTLKEMPRVPEEDTYKLPRMIPADELEWPPMHDNPQRPEDFNVFVSDSDDEESGRNEVSPATNTSTAPSGSTFAPPSAGGLRRQRSHGNEKKVHFKQEVEKPLHYDPSKWGVQWAATLEEVKRYAFRPPSPKGCSMEHMVPLSMTKKKIDGNGGSVDNKRINICYICELDGAAVFRCPECGSAVHADCAYNEGPYCTRSCQTSHESKQKTSIES